LGIHAGPSVIVDPADGKIPYLPAAAAKRDENFRLRATKDPFNKCFLPGVPRLMYLPHPFQIFQTPSHVAIASEYNHTTRTIYMQGSHYAEGEWWMGDSRGKWVGDTLVVDVSDLNADTWLDMSGNFHSEQLRVVERYTRTGPETLQYEATLTDAKVFARAWTIRIPLYLRKDAQLYEYECSVYLDDEKKKKSSTPVTTETGGSDDLKALSVPELNTLLNEVLEQEDYIKAIAIRDELNNRKK